MDGETTEQFIFFNHSFILFEEKGGFKCNIQYIFPFQIALPPQIPRSIEIIRKSISIVSEYFVKARLNIHDQEIQKIEDLYYFDYQEKEVLENYHRITKTIKLIINKKPPDIETSLQCSTYDAKIQQSKFICGSITYPLSVSIRLEKNLFHLDENIIGNILV